MTSKLFDMIRNFALGILDKLRGMIKDTALRAPEAHISSGSLPLWENPHIGRIDIRRTLSGSTGELDRDAGRVPS